MLFKVSKTKQAIALEKLIQADRKWSHEARMQEAGNNPALASIASHISFMINTRLLYLVRPVLIPATAEIMAPHKYTKAAVIQNGREAVRGWKTKHPDFDLH